MAQTGTVGIVGGGQLGRMLTDAARKLGWHVVVLDPTPDCPAAQVGAQQIVGDLYDATKIKELAAASDVITFEIEHVNVDALAALDKPVHPAPTTLRIIQDKLRQKEFLQSHNIPVAPFQAIATTAQAEQLLAEWGSLYLKSRAGGFDGRGNILVKTSNDLPAISDGVYYAEQVIPHKQELAVMISRDVHGQVATYPLTETFHERSICVETLTPAQVSSDIKKATHKLALEVADLMQGAGVFGIEMFLAPDDTLLVNEIAPRVHNSGHYTIEACETSQFENHIRAITGQPLGPTDLKVAAAAMVNILGERNGPVEPQGLEQAAAEPHTTVHIYGKSPTKVDRKMGHITATGDTLEQARTRAEQARTAISI